MPGRQTLLLQCFSDQANFSWPMPRCVSKDDLHQAFAKGWRIEKMDRVEYETRTEGNVPAWLAVIRRERRSALQFSPARPEKENGRRGDPPAVARASVSGQAPDLRCRGSSAACGCGSGA